MEDFLQKSCYEFLDCLAAPQPVPGGGGAAAMVGAIGVALANMLSNYTVDKPKYAQVQAELQNLLTEGSSYQKELAALVGKDAEAFYPLSQAYRLPKETEEEKKAKAEALENASKAACLVPLDIAQKCAAALAVCCRLAEIGNKMVLSDVICAAVFLQAALKAAGVNVNINLDAISDKNWVQEKVALLAELISQGDDLAEETMRKVNDRLREKK